MAEPLLAFVAGPEADAAIEIRVNFGVFAGRPATPAEIDELARRLLEDVTDVTIVAEERHEFDPAVEASVHQVRVEVGPDRAPLEAAERNRLAERLRATAEEWAQTCIADRHYDAADL
jgi:hypothetical protein